MIILAIRQEHKLVICRASTVSSTLLANISFCVWSAYWETVRFSEDLSSALQMSLDFQTYLTPPLHSLSRMHIESETSLPKRFFLIIFRGMEILTTAMGCYHLNIFLAMSWVLKKNPLFKMEIKTFTFRPDIYNYNYLTEDALSKGMCSFLRASRPLAMMFSLQL